MMNNELTDDEIAMLVGGTIENDEEAACPYSGESCEWARRGITDYCAGCDAIND